MSNHIEICPVCQGTGRYKEYTSFRDKTTIQTYIERTCHGCNGKGWISLKQKNKIENSKQFQVYISGMRSGKELLNKYINDSIPKNKIREKIKEIEDSLKEDCIALHEFQRLAKIDVLKEILGE